ncbi:MAG: EutN/CcmL family microcompartment protein [Verrucomicrobiae bacterium]
MGTVIGRVTLSVRNNKFQGERLLLALPWTAATFRGADAFAPAIVVFDELGANIGQHIAISEGREAACPFPKPTPVDAYCAALVDEHFYQE